MSKEPKAAAPFAEMDTVSSDRDDPDAPQPLTTIPSGGVDTIPSGGVMADSSVDLIGSLLAGRYRVLDQLGAGGMGTVYRAEHVAIRKEFAVKVLSTEFWIRRSSVERFLQEARTASKIRHENVVEITDFGFSDDKIPFLVMELLDGEELARMLARVGPLPWSRVRAIVLQILAALDAAHAQGIIHRDMKPQNCFLVPKEEGRELVKVLDFGLAKVITGDSEFQTISRTGAVMGTAHYMSPEQARSERLDVRADIYSVGVIAFELLTGHVPFEAPGFMGVLSKLLTQDTPKMAEVAPEVAVHPQVEATVRRAMAKDREDRFASAAEFAGAIRELPEELGAPRSRGRAWRGAVAGLGVVALVAVGLSMPWSDDASDLVEEDLVEEDLVEEDPVGDAPAEDVELAAAPEPEPEPEPEPSLDMAQAPAPVELRPEPTSEAPPVEPEPEPEPSATQRKRPKSGGGSSTKPAAALPDKPSNAGVNAALAAAKQASRACGSKHGALWSTASVSFHIAPNGEVSNARALPPLKGTPLGTCAAQAVSSQRFPESRQGLTKTVELPL